MTTTVGPEGPPQPKTGVHRLLRRGLSIIVTVAIFAAIFARIDLGELGRLLLDIDLTWLMAAAVMFPVTMSVSVERWRWMLSGSAKLPFWTGLRIFLSASSLNSVMPSKLGDLGKAVLLEKEGVTGLARGANSVILEKLLDLSGLCLVFVVGVVALGRYDAVVGVIAIVGTLVVVGTAFFLMADDPRNPLFRWGERLLDRTPRIQRLVVDTRAFVGEVKGARTRFFGILALSPLLWLLHLIQIYFFFLSMHAGVGLLVVLGLVPIAIFVGLLPVTVGGMGTRDAALIVLFAPYAPAEVMVGIGLLVSTRYWVPSLVGLPLLHRYMQGPQAGKDAR